MSRGPSVDRRFAGAALMMSGGVLLAKLSGFLRDAVIAATHGAGPATDAYFAAFTLPDLLSYMLSGGALSVAFLPIFSRCLAEGRDDEAWRVFSTVLTTMLALLAGLVLLGELLAPTVVPLLVPGYAPATQAHAAAMTAIVLPAQFAFYAGGIVSATLYAQERFLAPALAPLVYNLAIVAGGLLLGPEIDGFAYGALAGAFLGPLGLPLLAARRTLRLAPRLDVKDPDFVEFVKLSVPLMLGFSLLTVDEWLGRYFASAWPGAVTHLNNARRIMLVPTAVLGQAMAMASLPFLARLHATGEHAERDRVLGVGLRTVGEVTALAAAALLALALPAAVIVYGRGAYSPGSVAATAHLLEMYCLGIPAWGLQAVAVRAFYAARDTLTPMVVATTVTAASTPLYWALSKAWGPVGLPAAGVLGMWINAAATLAALRARGVDPDLPALLSALARAAGVAGLAALPAVAVRWAAGPLVWQGLGAWAILALGAVGFGVAVLLLVGPARLPETDALIARALQRLRGRARSGGPAPV